MGAQRRIHYHRDSTCHCDYRAIPHRQGIGYEHQRQEPAHNTLLHLDAMLSWRRLLHALHAGTVVACSVLLWRGSRVGLIAYNHSFVENQRTCRSRRRYGSRMLLACTTRTSRSANAMGVDNDSHSWSGIMGKTIPQSPHPLTGACRCLNVIYHRIFSTFTTINHPYRVKIQSINHELQSKHYNGQHIRPARTS